jgi:hypothetical protein
MVVQSDRRRPAPAQTSTAPVVLLKAAAGRVDVVDVPPITFLMVGGEGDPNGSVPYQQALEALYAASYTLKFALKKAEGRDYKVGPLEGLWWAPSAGAVPIAELMEHKDTWAWTMMIAQPDDVTAAQVAGAIEQARRKRPLPALDLLRCERFHEGPAAQTLHIGPYAAERPTIERLHAFIREQGYQLRGKHHEIYLGDPRRAAPERLRTIIRQPIAPAAGG